MTKHEAFVAFDYTKLMKDFDPMKPFKDFDPMKAFKEFDGGKFDMTKMFKDFKMPGVNVDQVIEMQKRNLEAMTEANKLAAEGVQALAKRQVEIVRQGLEEMGEAMKDLMTAPSPEAGAAKQAEIAKHVFERAISNLRELSELASKSNAEALEVISQRIAANLDEVKGLLPKQQ